MRRLMSSLPDCYTGKTNLAGLVIHVKTKVVICDSWPQPLTISNFPGFQKLRSSGSRPLFVQRDVPVLNCCFIQQSRLLHCRLENT